MALIKHDRRTIPFTEVTTWPDDWFDRTFRDYFPGWARLDRLWDGTPHQVMHLEEFVEDNACVIRAEMPGLDPDKDVEVSISEGVLTLKAHREERKEDKLPDEYRSEFNYGRFVRRIRLPEGITDAEVKASYKDGILEVRIPMPPAAVEPTPTKVPIEHS